MQSFVAGLDSYGIQASILSQGIKLVNKMLNWRLKDQDAVKYDYDENDLEDFNKKKCMVFLGCSSSVMSSGI